MATSRARPCREAQDDAAGGSLARVPGTRTSSSHVPRAVCRRAGFGGVRMRAARVFAAKLGRVCWQPLCFVIRN